VESVIEKLNTKYWYSTMQTKDDDSYQEAIESVIEKTSIPVRALLGKSVVSVNDFVNLQPGDIIRLGTKIDDELDIYVGNIKKFTALPGAYKDTYAVRVTSVIREE
jgi:flagellar motor switch protein FliM